MKKITSRLVKKIDPEVGSIVVILDDETVVYVCMVCAGNKEMVKNLLNAYAKHDHEYYFLNFSRSAFTHYMRKLIKE